MTLSPLNSFHQARIALTIGAIIVASALLVFFGLLPQTDAVSSIKSEIDQKQQRIAQVRWEIQSYQEVQANLKKLTGSDTMPEIFSKRENVLTLIEGLEGAVARSAGSHTLVLTDHEEQAAVSASSKPPARQAVIKELTGAEEIPYQLDYFGSYRQTVNFLLYLENLPFITRVGKLSLAAESVQSSEPGGDTRNTGNAFTQVDGLLFIQKP